MNRTERFDCPLAACNWQLMVREPSENSAAFAPMFGIAVMDASMYAEHVQRVEKQLREHFEAHKLEEWVAEIIRLNNELAAMRKWRDEHLC